MNITKTYNNYIKNLIIKNNLSDDENNLYIQNAFLHNSEGLHPVDKLSNLWGEYKKIEKVKRFENTSNGLLFKIYAELDEYFNYDTIYLANRNNKFLFVIKFDEVISQKIIIQEGLLLIDQDTIII